MGELTEFLERVKSNPKMGKVRFSQGFLDDVASVLEQRGFNEARLFIWEQRGRADVEHQVSSLLLILDEMEKVRKFKEDRAAGKYVLKNKLPRLLR